MAASLFRTTSNFLRRSVGLQSVRCAGGPPKTQKDPHEGKYPSDELSMGEGIGHHVGKTQLELKAHEYGDDDPFDMKTMKRGAGTFEEPNIVSSYMENRVIGCVCEEDSLVINWITVWKGEPKRCGCGHWFKLVDAQPKPYE